MHQHHPHQGSGLVHGEGGGHGLPDPLRAHLQAGRFRARPRQLLQRGFLKVPQEGVVLHRTRRRVHPLEADRVLPEGTLKDLFELKCFYKYDFFLSVGSVIFFGVCTIANRLYYLRFKHGCHLA